MLRRSMPILLLLSLILTACTRLPIEAGAAPSTPDIAARVPAALPSPSLVGGHQLGPEIACSTTCRDLLSFAESSAIDTLDLDPAAIKEHRVYVPFIPAGMSTSGGGYIVVYDLADGSQLAIRVHCGVGPCQVVSPQPVQPLKVPSPNDHGPLVDPLVEAPRDCSTPEFPTCNEAIQVAISTVTENGFLAAERLAGTHYYIIYLTAGSPDALAFKAEYIVNFYVAGDHDNLAETVVAVHCGSDPCQAVAFAQ